MTTLGYHHLPHYTIPASRITHHTTLYHHLPPSIIPPTTIPPATILYHCLPPRTMPPSPTAYHPLPPCVTPPPHTLHHSSVYHPLPPSTTTTPTTIYHTTLGHPLPYHPLRPSAIPPLTILYHTTLYQHNTLDHSLPYHSTPLNCTGTPRLNTLPSVLYSDLASSTAHESPLDRPLDLHLSSLHRVLMLTKQYLPQSQAAYPTYLCLLPQDPPLHPSPGSVTSLGASLFLLKLTSVGCHGQSCPTLARAECP